MLALVGLALFVQCSVLLKNASIRRNPNVWAEVEELAQKAQDDRMALLSANEIADLLVETIIQIESGGNARMVGGVGERGLMQIKPETWDDITARTYGTPLSFDRAFDPHVNETVGRLYLDYLQSILMEHKDQWRADERALLLACYNAGPGRVQRAGFDIKRLPHVVRDYVQRGTDLHDYLLAEQAGHVRHLLADYAAGPRTDG